MDGQGAASSQQIPARRRALRLVNTWPKRIGALLGSAFAAWAVGTFAPKLFEGTAKKIGIAPAPVHVAVQTDPDLINNPTLGHVPEFVVAKPIGAVTAPPSGDKPAGRYAWAHELGAVDALESMVRLVIRGQQSTPVVLTGLRVQTIERGPPLVGTLLSYFGLGAGQGVHYFEINLDTTPPTVKHIGGNQQPDAFFPFRVSRDDLEVFDMLVSTLKHDVRWKLLLDYDSADGSGTMTIDDHGRPFETTARADAETWKFVHGKGPPPQTFYAWSNARRRWVTTQP